MAKKFQPRAGATIAVLITCGILVALGVWQVQRLQWKTALIAQMEQQIAAPPQELPQVFDAATGDWSNRHVTMAGYFLNGHEFLVRPRTHDGMAGGDIIVPFQRASGDIVLVDRGFVPDGLTDYARPEGLSRVTGFVSRPVQGRFTPDNLPAKNQWYWIDIPAMAQAAGVKNAASYIVAAEQGDAKTAAPVYPLGRAMTVDLPNNHAQYAFFWFSMAGILLGIYFIYHWREEDLAEL